MSRVRVKICGITSPADALDAVEAGADALGLVFAPSPRKVDVPRAAEILAVLPPYVTPVGLFVDAPVRFIQEVTAELGLNCVQLHGNEPPETVNELAPLLVIKAFRIVDEYTIQIAREWCAKCRRKPAGVLFDAYSPKVAGGTGQTFDWSLLPAASEQPAWPAIILAGGLRSENVAAAIQRVSPYAVDTSSGVEKSPGVKDPELVRAFIKAARSALD